MEALGSLRVIQVTIRTLDSLLTVDQHLLKMDLTTDQLSIETEAIAS